MLTRILYVEGRYRIVERTDRVGYLQITATINGQRYRIAAGTDLRQAKSRLQAFIYEMESGYRPGAESGSWEAIAKAVTLRQKYAAKDRSIPFEITSWQVYSMMREIGFKCSVSGIALSKRAKGEGEVDPWAPSIDRIDSRQGYLRDNVRIVCAAANYAMNRWGYDMLLRLSRGVVRSSVSVAPEPEIVEPGRYQARFG